MAFLAGRPQDPPHTGVGILAGILTVAPWALASMVVWFEPDLVMTLGVAAALASGYWVAKGRGYAWSRLWLVLAVAIILAGIGGSVGLHAQAENEATMLGRAPPGSYNVLMGAGILASLPVWACFFIAKRRADAGAAGVPVAASETPPAA